MRHLIALVMVVGCSDPPAAPAVEIYPGPVATVTQGGLLQLAARFDSGSAGAVTFDLQIDDPVAALFDVHTITQTDTGAIVSLVPSCAALGSASNGVVAMSVGAVGQDVPRAMLTIDIVADLAGVCAGAPEHAITVTNFQVANVPDSGRVLCTKASLATPSLNDPAREVLRLYGPTGKTAGNDQLLCDASDVRLELWPPIDAPAIEQFKVATFACATDGCKASAEKCCLAEPERATELTSSVLSVPIHSVAELDDMVDTITLGCADLDRDGTPEIMLAGGMKTIAKIGAAGRYTNQQQPRVINLLGFAWQPDLLASHTEWTIIGALGTDIVRASLVQGVLSWVIDPRLAFDTGTATPAPSSMVPVATTPSGAATYVARMAGTTLLVTCISQACAGNPAIPPIDIDIGSIDPLTFGLADYNGDGDEDFVVAYKDHIAGFGGSNPVHLRVFPMHWGQSPPTADPPITLPTLDAPGYEVHLVGVPSVKSCQRIEVLSRGGWSSIFEVTPSCTGAAPTVAEIPTVNNVRSIAALDGRLIAATVLGVFDLEHVVDTMGDHSVWRLEDPLLEEHLLGTGETLIDSTSRYAEEFAACFAATPSIAFRTARNGFEWTQLDARVETFSAGSSP